MAITRQPVKGRKKHGGIRLGEMERDALLSHGVAFCLHDRLMNSSDKHVAHICSGCGGLLTVQSTPRRADVVASAHSSSLFSPTAKQICSSCKTGRDVRPVYLPYVYRYLVNELAAMGIKVTMKLSD
jgi:DNA-directed RNA polymerase I subunit RPA2